MLAYWSTHLGLDLHLSKSIILSDNIKMLPTSTLMFCSHFSRYSAVVTVICSDCYWHQF